MALPELNASHNRKGFDCANDLINKFLRETARRAGKHNLSRSFVLEGECAGDIAGFYTLSDTQVSIPIDHKFYKNYPHPLPAVLLARMGVDRHYQGQGYAKILVIDAMQRTLHINRQLGVVGLFVDAKDDALVAFYQKVGFIFLQQEIQTTKLWMPIKSIENFFATHAPPD
ncbi:GNAT family N-acetyltransferase [Maribrevibacterium harenarium]|uniref:GNAT family N-acetyltransferase n=1 Tax=Maribrevibacterium harenarium TaxID=2589817 RepID=A0A501WIY6_9GAMM|nr:GNAT family N-acetyltransferase [Maribrevibacterium harenarium]TPE49318.1 GNAT family N-acetyltransferase [Maribrevibacterium harenarium]